MIASVKVMAGLLFLFCLVILIPILPVVRNVPRYSREFELASPDGKFAVIADAIFLQLTGVRLTLRCGDRETRLALGTGDFMAGSSVVAWRDDGRTSALMCNAFSRSSAVIVSFDRSSGRIPTAADDQHVELRKEMAAMNPEVKSEHFQTAVAEFCGSYETYLRFKDRHPTFVTPERRVKR
jgi:hypothetical protein